MQEKRMAVAGGREGERKEEGDKMQGERTAIAEEGEGGKEERVKGKILPMNSPKNMVKIRKIIL